jgi:predicted ATPase
MAEALAVGAIERPLILVLEDLHWSDHATLDLIAWLARQQGPARLLVLGTYRPADVRMQGHPLEAVVHELKLHRRGDELALTMLTEAAVAEYLSTRFPSTALPQGLVHLVHQRTDGNPLFMVNVVDVWEAEGWLEEVEGQRRPRLGLDELAQRVPESLRQMLMQQLDRLSAEEQRVLEAASVAGVEFSAAAVAAGTGLEVVEAETQCERLARRQHWLRAIGIEEWPDGTVAGRYAFIHALYQQVVSQQLAAARRVHLHRRIGASKEGAYGEQSGEIAAELAVHFEHGRDHPRAVRYLQQAADNAIRRYAHREAITSLNKALRLLKALPTTPERFQQELDLQLALGPALMATQGPAAPEVEQTYARARTLCAQVGETPQLLPTLWGLWRFYQIQGALLTARELGEQLLRVAKRTADPTPRLEAHSALGATLFHLGDYPVAWMHLDQGIALIDPAAQQALVRRYDVAPGVQCLTHAALTLWCLGAPAQAVQRSQEALALAQALAHPHSLVLAQHFAAYLHYRRREVSAVEALADALIPLATAQGFPLYVGDGTCWRGWALAVQGRHEAGLTQLRRGLAAALAMRQTVARPRYLVLLAEAAEHAGQVEEGLRLLAEALTALEANGQGDLLAEAYRLQGELRLRQAVPDTAEAEACFLQALAIARRQQAKSWELRIAMSLGRLWRRQGKCAAAHALLADIYERFTEGFDTADLQEAKGLLAELS